MEYLWQTVQTQLLGKTNNAKLPTPLFLFFKSIPSRNSIFLWFILGKQANHVTPSLSVTVFVSYIPSAKNQQICFSSAPGVQGVILQMSRNPGKAVLLHLRSYLQACRTGDTDHTHLRSCQEQLCGSAVCLSSIDIGLSIICKSAVTFISDFAPGTAPTPLPHPFLAFFGGKDKLTILFCKIQILGIFVYNISPVTGG